MKEWREMQEMFSASVPINDVSYSQHSTYETGTGTVIDFQGEIKEIPEIQEDEINSNANSITNSITNPITNPITNQTTYNTVHQINPKIKKLPERKVDSFFVKNCVDMKFNPSVLTQIDTYTLTPATHEQSHPVMGLEEVTVDEAAVTQGESLEEPNTNRTINGDTLTSLVEGQGMVRDILDANGMVQGLTSPEKPQESSLEAPTEGKKDTQSAPVADNGDKGEDGPGEL